MTNKKVVSLSLLSVCVLNMVTPTLVSAKTIKLDEIDISIPNNLPSFNESISQKYENALSSLKEEGYNGDLNTNITENNSSLDKTNSLFLDKFPNYNNSLNTEVVEEKMQEMQNAFSEVYESSKKEELPSKEATLIWNKEEVLNSAIKPEGYEEALKKTTSKLEGGVSNNFKNDVENKVNSIFSYLEIHQNDKPKQPETPSVGKAPTPDTPVAEKPDLIPVPDLKVPELERPTANSVDLPPITSLPIIPSGGGGTPSTSVVPETVPQTVPNTSTSTVPNTSTSTKPSTSPSTSSNSKPVTKPSTTPVPTPGTVPQKDDETDKGKGNSWKDSIIKGGLITAAGVAIYKGFKVVIGAAVGGVPGAIAGALT